MASINLSKKTDLARLRKITLDRQGLFRDATFGKGKPAALRAIEHIGYVQIDTISVVERAHNHVWRSRVPNFTAVMVDRLLGEGSIFEYWAHAASFLPMCDYRFSLPTKQRYITGEARWVRSRDTKLIGEVLGRIRSEGPLRSRDLDDPNTKRRGWWDWKPAKRAVEQLYMQGDLMISSREGFQKSYNLTERVLPDNVDTSMPSVDELATHLFQQALRCHGLVTLKGITYARRRFPQLRQAAKTLVEDHLDEGLLDTIQIPSGQAFYAEPGLLDRAPRAAATIRFLSPFDNAVIQRDRLDALFQFDYQIECYVPEANRKFGYFSLPILFHDLFIGRMDCKAHRKTRVLEIRQLHFEDGIVISDEVIDAFVAALPRFMEFQDCDEVVLSQVNPSSARQALAGAIRAGDSQAAIAAGT